MFLIEKSTDHLVEILDHSDLFNPYREELRGRYNIGEEAQDSDSFDKSDLMFLSGEALPRCWVDPHYRDDAVVKSRKRSFAYRGTHY